MYTLICRRSLHSTAMRNTLLCVTKLKLFTKLIHSIFSNAVIVWLTISHCLEGRHTGLRRPSTAGRKAAADKKNVSENATFYCESAECGTDVL